MAKVDSVGQYLPFDGVTVVASAVSAANQDILEELYRALSSNEMVVKNFSLLPVSSYHMTTTDLATQVSFIPGTFTTFVDNNLPWFRKLHAKLTERQFPLNVTCNTVHVGGVIMLFLQLNPEQDDVLHNVAEEFNIAEKIPSSYHITFGYRFTAMTAQELQILEAEVNALFNAVFDKFRSRQLQLQPTKLCYFHDMTAFIPWNGDRNPFLKF